MIVFGIIGLVIFFISFYDIIWTTLSASETGPISFGIMICYKYIGKIFKKLRGIHRILRVLGLLTFITTVFVWYFLLWIAWSFIFWSVEGNVINSATGLSADKMEKIYFTGWLIFTAGLGDYKPVGYTFQILTVLGNCIGVVMVAITISYLVSATDAVTRQRQLAGQISALGNSPSEIICNAWNGIDFSLLDASLRSLADDISKNAQQLIRFPLIFNFHSIEILYSPVVKLIVLDETITIINNCVKLEHGLTRLRKIQICNAIDQYIYALKRIGIRKIRKIKTPPIPSLQQLKNQAIPLIEDTEIIINFSNNRIVERRNLLNSLLIESGRKWDDIYPS